MLNKVLKSIIAFIVVIISILSFRRKAEAEIMDNTFVFPDETNDLDGIETEIGDAKQPDFHPQIKIKKWDNECNFSARLLNDESDETEVIVGENIIECIKPKMDIHFYPEKIDRTESFKQLNYGALKPKSSYEVRWEDEPYNKVFVDDVLWGADAPERIKAYTTAAKTAFGDVLIAGLGTGAVLEILLDNPNVTSVTTIEISQEVIDICSTKKPHLFNQSHYSVICDDYYDFVKTTDKKFDWVGGDIWDSICFNPAYVNDWLKFKELSQRLLKQGGVLHPVCFGEYAESVLSAPLEETNNFEFEVILKEKPTTNQMRFSIQSKGLDFFYQPALSDEQVKRGYCRPEDVVGSYAVYHKTKKDYLVGDKNYRAGKAFHIYRPRIEDAEGTWVWGELNIDEQAGILSVIIPQEFLDNAVYPVRHAAGLKFGYETAGGSNGGIGDIPKGSIFTSGVAGTGDSISAYMNIGAGVKRKQALHLHSDLSFVTNGATNEATGGSGATWYTQNFGTSPTIAASTVYLINACTDNPKASHSLYYDSGDTDQGHDDQTNNYAGYPQNPFVVDVHNTNKYSIYCTYTGSAAPSYRRRVITGFMKLKTILVGAIIMVVGVLGFLIGRNWEYTEIIDNECDYYVPYQDKELCITEDMDGYLKELIKKQNSRLKSERQIERILK